jgi:hypothetical protein
MIKREKAFAMHLSINTGDDVDVSAYSKRAKYGAAGSTTSSSITITPLAKALAAQSMDAPRSSAETTNQESYIGSSRPIVRASNGNALSAADVSTSILDNTAAMNAAQINATAESVPNMCASNDMPRSAVDLSTAISDKSAASNAARMNAMEEKMRQLESKLRQSRREPNQAFIYKELSLVDDFGGKNPVKWGLKVASHLWTKEELERHVLFATPKSQRPALSVLDPPEPAIQRVKLLLLALPAKFEYCQDKQKFDKHVAMMAEQINTKGRNLAYRVREVFRFNNRTAEQTPDVNNNNI